MPATKKRLKKLVTAVSEILGDPREAKKAKKLKKLKKAKALDRFIAKLEDRHREMENELFDGALEGKAAEEHAGKTKSLAKQIGKAKKILEGMKEPEDLSDASTDT